MRREQSRTPIAVVGRTLARDAVLLARVASPEDADVARRLAAALKDPQRVERFLNEDQRQPVPA